MLPDVDNAVDAAEAAEAAAAPAAASDDTVIDAVEPVVVAREDVAAPAPDDALGGDATTSFLFLTVEVLESGAESAASATAASSDAIVSPLSLRNGTAETGMTAALLSCTRTAGAAAAAAIVVASDFSSDLPALLE